MPRRKLKDQKAIAARKRQRKATDRANAVPKFALVRRIEKPRILGAPYKLSVADIRATVDALRKLSVDSVVLPFHIGTKK